MEPVDRWPEVMRGWLRKARNDLTAADSILAGHEVPYDTVCFHCQQAAEKALKALLVRHHRRPPRTHSLEELMDLLEPHLHIPDEVREAAACLEEYSVDVRYPGLYAEPEEEDASGARRDAQRVVEWVRSGSLPDEPDAEVGEVETQAEAAETAPGPWARPSQAGGCVGGAEGVQCPPC
jgi:HEPN domain-containing protein